MEKTIEKIESVAKMLNGRHMPKPYEVYKHFKGNLYVVLNVARHTETNELLVIYSNVREMQRIFARPLQMFMSEVDHEKYPDAKQKYRFENMMEGLIYDHWIFKWIIYRSSYRSDSNVNVFRSEREG